MEYNVYGFSKYIFNNNHCAVSYVPNESIELLGKCTFMESNKKHTFSVRNEYGRLDGVQWQSAPHLIVIEKVDGLRVLCPEFCTTANSSKNEAWFDDGNRIVFGERFAMNALLEHFHKQIKELKRLPPVSTIAEFTKKSTEGVALCFPFITLGFRHKGKPTTIHREALRRHGRVITEVVTGIRININILRINLETLSHNEMLKHIVRKGAETPELRMRCVSIDKHFILCVTIENSAYSGQSNVTTVDEKLNNTKLQNLKFPSTSWPKIDVALKEIVNFMFYDFKVTAQNDPQSWITCHARTTPCKILEEETGPIPGKCCSHKTNEVKKGEFSNDPNFFTMGWNFTEEGEEMRILEAETSSDQCSSVERYSDSEDENRGDQTEQSDNVLTINGILDDENKNSRKTENGRTLHRQRTMAEEGRKTRVAKLRATKQMADKQLPKEQIKEKNEKGEILELNINRVTRNVRNEVVTNIEAASSESCEQSHDSEEDDSESESDESSSSESSSSSFGSSNESDEEEDIDQLDAILDENRGSAVSTKNMMRRRRMTAFGSVVDQDIVEAPKQEVTDQLDEAECTWMPSDASGDSADLENDCTFCGDPAEGIQQCLNCKTKTRCCERCSYFIVTSQNFELREKIQNICGGFKIDDVRRTYSQADCKILESLESRALQPTKFDSFMNYQAGTPGVICLFALRMVMSYLGFIGRAARLRTNVERIVQKIVGDTFQVMIFEENIVGNAVVEFQVGIMNRQMYSHIFFNFQASDFLRPKRPLFHPHEVSEAYEKVIQFVENRLFSGMDDHQELTFHIDAPLRAEGLLQINDYDLLKITEKDIIAKIRFMIIERESAKDIEQVIQYLTPGAWLDHTGTPLILVAMKHKNLRVANMLLTAESEIDGQFDVGDGIPKNLLEIAIHLPHRRFTVSERLVVRLTQGLLKRKCIPQSTDVLNRVRRNDDDIVDLLIDYLPTKHNTKNQCLVDAFGIANEYFVPDSTMIDTLMKKFNKKNINLVGSKARITPLMMIFKYSTKENIELALRLLDLKASILSMDDGGLTPLYYAMASSTRHLKQQDVNKLLDRMIELKANINDRFKDGRPLLHLSITLKDEGLWARALITAKADIHACDLDNGNSAAHFIGVGMSYHVAECIIKEKANVNSTNNVGDTPLRYAAAYSNCNAIELLIDSQADPNIKNKAGCTPLDLAFEILTQMKVTQPLPQKSIKIRDTPIIKKRKKKKRGRRRYKPWHVHLTQEFIKKHLGLVDVKQKEDMKKDNPLKTLHKTIGPHITVCPKKVELTDLIYPVPQPIESSHTLPCELPSNNFKLKVSWILKNNRTCNIIKENQKDKENKEEIDLIDNKKEEEIDLIDNKKEEEIDLKIIYPHLEGRTHDHSSDIVDNNKRNCTSLVQLSPKKKIGKRGLTFSSLDKIIESQPLEKLRSARLDNSQISDTVDCVDLKPELAIFRPSIDKTQIDLWPAFHKSNTTSLLSPRSLIMNPSAPRRVSELNLQQGSNSNKLNLSGGNAANVLEIPQNSTKGRTAAYDPNRTSIYDPKRNSIYDPHRNTTYDPKRNSIYNPHRNTTYDPKRNSIYNPHRNTTYDPKRNSMYDPNRNSMYDPNRNSMYDPHRNTTYDPSRNSIYDPYRNSMYDPNRNTTYDPSRMSTYDPSSNNTEIHLTRHSVSNPNDPRYSLFNKNRNSLKDNRISNLPSINKRFGVADQIHKRFSVVDQIHKKFSVVDQKRVSHTVKKNSISLGLMVQNKKNFQHQTSNERISIKKSIHQRGSIQMSLISTTCENERGSSYEFSPMATMSQFSSMNFNGSRFSAPNMQHNYVYDTNNPEIDLNHSLKDMAFPYKSKKSGGSVSFNKSPKRNFGISIVTRVKKAGAKFKGLKKRKAASIGGNALDFKKGKEYRITENILGFQAKDIEKFSMTSGKGLPSILLDSNLWNENDTLSNQIESKILTTISGKSNNNTSTTPRVHDAIFSGPLGKTLQKTIVPFAHDQELQTEINCNGRELLIHTNFASESMIRLTQNRLSHCPRNKSVIPLEGEYTKEPIQQQHHLLAIAPIDPNKYQINQKQVSVQQYSYEPLVGIPLQNTQRTRFKRVIYILYKKGTDISDLDDSQRKILEDICTEIDSNLKERQRLSGKIKDLNKINLDSVDKEGIHDTDTQKNDEDTEIQKNDEDTEIQKDDGDTEIQKNDEDTEIQKDDEYTEIQKDDEDTEIQKDDEDTEIQKIDENVTRSPFENNQSEKLKEDNQKEEDNIFLEKVHNNEMLDNNQDNYLDNNKMIDTNKENYSTDDKKIKKEEEEEEEECDKEIDENDDTDTSPHIFKDDQKLKKEDSTFLLKDIPQNNNICSSPVDSEFTIKTDIDKKNFNGTWIARDPLYIFPNLKKNHFISSLASGTKGSDTIYSLKESSSYKNNIFMIKPPPVPWKGSRASRDPIKIIRPIRNPIQLDIHENCIYAEPIKIEKQKYRRDKFGNITYKSKLSSDTTISDDDHPSRMKAHLNSITSLKPSQDSTQIPDINSMDVSLNLFQTSDDDFSRSEPSDSKKLLKSTQKIKNAMKLQNVFSQRPQQSTDLVSFKQNKIKNGSSPIRSKKLQKMSSHKLNSSQLRQHSSNHSNKLASSPEFMNSKERQSTRQSEIIVPEMDQLSDDDQIDNDFDEEESVELDLTTDGNNPVSPDKSPAESPPEESSSPIDENEFAWLDGGG